MRVRMNWAKEGERILQGVEPSAVAKGKENKGEKIVKMCTLHVEISSLFAGDFDDVLPYNHASRSRF